MKGRKQELWPGVDKGNTETRQMILPASRKVASCSVIRKPGSALGIGKAGSIHKSLLDVTLSIQLCLSRKVERKSRGLLGLQKAAFVHSKQEDICKILVAS